MNCLVNAFPNNKTLSLSHEVRRLKEHNCIVPIRSPQETIPSASLFFNEKDIDGIIRWHDRFMSAVLGNVEKIILVDFYTLIKDPNKEMSKIGKVYNTKPETVDSSNFPKNENSKKYEKIDKHDKRIEKSMSIYNQLYRLCKSQETLIQ